MRGMYQVYKYKVKSCQYTGLAILAQDYMDDNKDFSLRRNEERIQFSSWGKYYIVLGEKVINV